MIYSNPSFETEKHTDAFVVPMLWWAVSLISMFTVGTGVTAIGLCGASVLKITSTFLQDNTIIVLMLFFAVAIIIFFIGLLRFAAVLTTSYKFDSNTIIKGTLAVRGGLISKITANTDFEFVRANFDTDRYKKTIYENAVLTGETKRYLKYSSNGRTIKILKIYDSMPDLRIAENTVKKSVASRVIKRAALVFAIFLALEITDLCIGYGKNDEKQVKTAISSKATLQLKRYSPKTAIQCRKSATSYIFTLNPQPTTAVHQSFESYMTKAEILINPKLKCS